MTRHRLSSEDIFLALREGDCVCRKRRERGSLAIRKASALVGRPCQELMKQLWIFLRPITIHH